MKTFSAIVLALLLSGCSVFLITEWEDVSTEPEFIELIDVELISKKTLRAHGVTMEPNYEKILSHYDITVLPGFAGPEVLSVTTIPIGTTCKIDKVVRCKDCIIKYAEL